MAEGAALFTAAILPPPHTLRNARCACCNGRVSSAPGGRFGISGESARRLGKELAEPGAGSLGPTPR
ncbi:hypothetical protein GCM10010246_17160 [Streptomyces cuspidosporus]|uniref:Uncharacterized protein n=1 Tax=Streptomyces cuspidosporus TaxID=66882 RepID=A0ABN3FN12_9ACTN